MYVVKESGVRERCIPSSNSFDRDDMHMLLYQIKDFYKYSGLR